ncbi:nucleolar protein 9 [Anthonomus grandis grandis]|uniref:nucleolar protein 9 n=1 Tax=Anthonomus grandis grandis TaxID=2921223 RepID=UPI00216615ED|nr:nucleolar protein 9 [Anthonomus grandis grandis]XP_050307332.1 nucleolar protein 9 [Anthonomus grandis grandis]XP_050307341.1 nucleolar protein 9 [Anthonomus grandis grandis]XP_050307348.1 nucleolar protein 9 [Anthonomus grandis grandis]XP_050307358.1 nucleolar protein 9 [Anthonomus grandis grandis]XP_050307367.1 nucleolar protein 9 [Anthonomus grandis grandis]
MEIINPQDSTTPNNRNKRKRKKTFLQNAKKYAKKGYYGRGSHMDADTYQYFVRILEAYKEGFESNEDRDAFVENVFEQTIDKEIECSCNQVGCRVIETLLPFANDQVLQRFMNKFSEDLRPLSKDRFASFVLQALVSIACRKTHLKESNENTCTYETFVVKISKFLLNNLEDYAWDNFGNRIIRTCFSGLAQIVEDQKRPHAKGVKIDNHEIALDAPLKPEFVEIVKEYGERLLVWPQFSQLCSLELTSGMLQVLLKALKKCDNNLLKKYLKKLLNEHFLKESDENNTLPPGFMSTSMLMLLETCLQVAGKKDFNAYWEKLFCGRVLKLACMRSTNFAVQKLIGCCYNKEQFDSIFEELHNNFQEILEKGHPAVLLALCEGCKRLSSKQGAFFQSMMKCLNCLEPEENQNRFTLAMCRLRPFDPTSPVSDENLSKEKLNLQGALMLQRMLEFNKPIKLVNSILSMDPDVLKMLFSNSMGSHIVDSYMTSSFVGERSRERLIWKMKGKYQELASSKFGSRSFEALWNAATMKAKLSIMEELGHKDGAWSNSEYGKIIAGKVNLVMFKRNKENWKNSYGKEAKPEKMLEAILK